MTIHTVCGLVLLGELAAVLLAVLISRAPLRAIGRLFGGKSPGPDDGAEDQAFDPSPDLRGQIGKSAFAVLRRAFRRETAIDAALAAVDPDFPRDDGRESGPYDYVHNQEKTLARRGLIFRWLAVRPGYIRDVAHMSDEISETYLNASRRFFRSQVRIRSDAGLLFEDELGAAFINAFRLRDRNGYYLLNEMRRLINDNVRKLAFLTTGVLLAVLIVSVFVPNYLDTALVANVTGRRDVLGIAVTWWDRSLTGLGLCALGLVLLWLTYRMEYVPHQRNNGQELRSFLSRYTSRLSDRYREALANARAVTVGDETEGAILSAAAQKWHKIMLWMAFRAFYIEGFVRNVLYQIVRNSGYYIVYVPLGLFALIAVSAVIVSHAAGVDLLALLEGPGPFFYAAYAALLMVAARLLRAALDPIDEMNQRDWIGFDDLDVDKGMDDIVGKYAEDVGYWKSRLDR